MKNSISAVCLFVFISICVNAQNWSPEQCLKMKNITVVRVSPDGNKVLYTVREAIMTDDRSEYVNQVYVCNADGSNTIQLTRGDKNSSNPKWSSDGKWIAYTSNRDGKNNLYILPINGGEAEKLTDVKGSVGEYEWSHDGTMIAYLSNDVANDAEEKNKKSKNDWYYYDEDYKQNRIYVLWLTDRDSSGKRKWKQVSKDNRNVNGFDWSPDGKQIVYSHGKSAVVNDNIYADISLVTVASGAVKPVAITNAGETNPLFSPDGKQIVYYCSEDPVDWSGPRHARIYSVEDGKTWRLKATPDENGGILGWTADGKNILWGEANKTLYSVYSLSVDGKSITEWNKGSGQLLSTASLNSSGTHLGFILQGTSQFPEAYVSALTSYSPIKLTSINADVATKPLPKTEVIKWKSADGKEIEGLLTYPINYQPGQKVPLILNVHGGPAGVFTQTCIAANGGSYPIAAMAEMGYAVLRPNPRGSSGYGTAFRTANRRDWGGEDYKDLMAGVDAVIKMGVGDADKLGVMGWSYGGFMSSWIVTHTDRFKVASIGAPVVDLSHQNMTDDIQGFLPSYMKANPWDDWAVYDAHSPLRFVQNVKTPVMLQHGEADARVPFSNSVMFYNALKRRGVPVRLLALPRQPHGPTEPRMNLIAMRTNVDWFAKYLGEKKGF
jgi:dipeptidyl aminopeptidase/acylaminoacyl peptidase